ncbi:MAG: HAMP domain-containing sensor histidine kinase [Cyclobacteriaceae bacterium]|jgi:two-component system phosphate regulon sensor histidine kinase PhoR|nr:HAMP domain-containing sensor histidine kinase [Cyclobacteriaceae bacterium]
MSKNRLGWIITLMSVALTGLIAFQWYWIDTVISGNRDHFERDVMTALSNVTKKLEQQEALFYVNRKMSNFSSQGQSRGFQPFQFQAIPPLNQRQILQGEKKIRFDDSLSSTGSFNFSFEVVGAPLRSNQMGKAFFDVLKSNINNIQFAYPQDAPETEMLNSNLKEILEKISNKSDMMMGLLEDMMLPKIGLTNRFDPDQLDSLLHTELKKKSIDIPYDYAIINPRSGRLIEISKDYSNERLLQSNFKTNLFPNDVTNEPNLLVIDFPSQEKYLMSKIWFPLSSSALLILIILICFGYAVFTIIRQKKISVMKTDFMNNMTHEFKTPISTIGLAIEALLDPTIPQKPSMKMKYLGIIAGENKRLESQVADVLQMAQLDKNELKLNLVTVDLHAIIQQAVDKISIQMERKLGHLKLALNASRFKFKGDEAYLLGVLLNLLDNALKYSTDAPNIMIRTQNIRGQLICSIKDHGMGMSKEAQRSIFQKFYRVASGNVHNIKGFGLGLAYVKEIITLHHGSIEVESELKKGTNFIVKFPLDYE